MNCTMLAIICTQTRSDFSAAWELNFYLNLASRKLQDLRVLKYTGQWQFSNDRQISPARELSDKTCWSEQKSHALGDQIRFSPDLDIQDGVASDSPGRGRRLAGISVLPHMGQNYATIPTQNMHFVKGNQRLKLIAANATSSLKMRFRYQRFWWPLNFTDTLEMNVFLTASAAL